MTEAKICSAVVISTLAAVIAGNVLAQEASPSNQPLRNTLRQAARIASDSTRDASKEGDLLKGRVVVLREAGDPTANGRLPDTQVNAGGLVIVEVGDTEGMPTKFDNPNIEPSDAFEQLGRVNGGEMAHGKAIAGGEYTWLLLRAVKPGDATISVSYQRNGSGEAVTRKHQIAVTD